MRRAPSPGDQARLAAVAVAAAVAIFGGRAAAEAVAEPCPAAVALRGDASAVAVGKELRRRGLAIDAREGCGALAVEVRESGEVLRVEIADAAGRRVTRRLAGVRAAATVIESWARSDVADRKSTRLNSSHSQ